MRVVPVDQPSGAAWYSGPGHRYTDDGEKPKTIRITISRATPVPNGSPVSGRTIPLGLPVVPEE
jgi:hypothetical protein